MTNRERSDWRDRAYSKWHRELDDRLSFLDVDWIERCDGCKRPLAVCELAVDTGRDDKAYYTTQRLAKALDAVDRQGTVRGYVVLYTKGRTGSIIGFRVREVHPRDTAFYALTPDQWAERLYRLRWCHPVTPAERPVVSSSHIHGYAEVEEGVWKCVADHYGRGPGCGELVGKPAA